MKNIILITIILLSFTGCDLFTTRIGEKPDQIKSNWRTPVEARDVIENLKNSLADKNVQNYLACFVDTLFASKSFSFSASSEALSLYQMQGWGIVEENGYLNSVFNKVPKDIPITLTLNDTVYSSLGGDSTIYSASYDLNVPSTQSNPNIYSGNLEFRMLRDSRSWWVIYFWKDTKSQSLPSWSELKGSSY
jgi:hypothetical protein